MQDHVYKTLEITGSSTASMEQAVERAVQITRKTVDNLRWFEVTDIRGHIQDGAIDHWQVTVKIGFTVEQST